MHNDHGLEALRQFWDNEAATFDEEPDHGLRHPVTQSAWQAKLASWLPSPRVEVLDIGCGTGSLSLVMDTLGHQVTGVDFSPEMVARAKAKAAAAGKSITFTVMDAARPQFHNQKFDVVLCRHVLWALPAPSQVLERWCDLLKANGRFILIEGWWHTGAGMPANTVLEALPKTLQRVSVERLSDQPELWGGPVTDERYVVLAQ